MNNNIQKPLYFFRVGWVAIPLDNLPNLDNLPFLSFAKHMKWEPAILRMVEAGENLMTRKTKEMKDNSALIDQRQSFLQHLEIGKQIEAYSKKVDKHTYNAIIDLAFLQSV